MMAAIFNLDIGENQDLTIYLLLFSVSILLFINSFYKLSDKWQTV